MAAAAVVSALPSLQAWPLGNAEEQKERLKLFLLEFDLEVAKRCEAMRTELKANKMAITKAFSCELVKIPQKYQTMTVSKFLQLRQMASEAGPSEEGVAVDRLTSRDQLMQPVEPPSTRTRNGSKRRVLEEQCNEMGPPPSTAVKRSKAAKGETSVRASTRNAGARSRVQAFETPAAPAAAVARVVQATPAFDPRLPATPLVRKPKDGECLLSENGSPIRVDADGVRVRQGQSARDTIITVPLTNGKALELNTEALAEQDVGKVVPKRYKAEAYKQLESLQAQVAQLMRQLMG